MIEDRWLIAGIATSAFAITVVAWATIKIPEDITKLLKDFARDESTRGKAKTLIGHILRYLRFLRNAAFPVWWAVRLSIHRVFYASIAGLVLMAFGAVAAWGFSHVGDSAPAVSIGDLLTIVRAQALRIADALTFDAFMIAGIEVEGVAGELPVRFTTYGLHLAIALVLIRNVEGLVATMWTAALCVIFPEPMHKVAADKRETPLQKLLARVSMFSR